MRTAVLGGTSVVVVAVVVLVVTLLPSSSRPQAAATSSSTTPSTTPQGTPLPPPKHTVSHTCPLTGERAPDGRVPQRPALAAKIGNDPGSRPQTGLPDADIVYEEMAEGGVTRYMAIFQCKNPVALGPMRSVRWDDWHLLASYGHPILAFSGGILQWDQAVASLSTNMGSGAGEWLFDGNGSMGNTQNAFYRTNTNIAPYNDFLNTSKIWSLDPDHSPPPPQFVYSTKAPSEAHTAASGSIANFADGSTVTWKWDGASHYWLRYVGGARDTDVSKAQLHANNVIIELMSTKTGPYSESCDPEYGCANDVESISEGSGPAYILRNGVVEQGTWSCPKYGDVTAYHFSDHKVMTLEAGNTWVEVVPNRNYPVTFSR